MSIHFFLQALSMCPFTLPTSLGNRRDHQQTQSRNPTDYIGLLWDVIGCTESGVLYVVVACVLCSILLLLLHITLAMGMR